MSGELSLPLQEVHITSEESGMDGVALPRSVSCILVDAQYNFFSLLVQTQEYVDEVGIAQVQEGLIDERPEPVFMVPEAGIDEGLIHRILGGMSADLLGLYMVPQAKSDLAGDS